MPDSSSYQTSTPIEKITKRAEIWSLKNLGAIIEFEWQAFLYLRNIILGQLFVEPIVYITLLAAGLQGMNNTIEYKGILISYMTYAFPGILAIQTIRTLSRVLVRASVDRRWGILSLKLLYGTGPLAYVLGMSLIPLVAFLLQALISLPLVWLLGAKFTLPAVVFTLFAGIVATGFWCSVGLIAATALRNENQRDLVLSVALLPLMFAAPTFISLSTAPLYLKIIAAINPLSYQVTAMRNPLVGDYFSWALLVSIVLTVVAVFAAAWIVKRMKLVVSQA